MFAINGFGCSVSGLSSVSVIGTYFLEGIFAINAKRACGIGLLSVFSSALCSFKLTVSASIFTSGFASVSAYFGSG